MTGETLITLALMIPTVGTMLIWLASPNPNLREATTLVTAGALFAVVLMILSKGIAGEWPSLHLLTIFPGVDLAFSVEPLGMLFACVASGLWIVNSVYSIGYMRGNKEVRQTQFYMCFAVALASTIGIAFSANLFTLFLFYEVLTLSTYPLVAHKADDNAKAGARIYLLILLGTSMVLLLPAIIATALIAGTVDFAPGGILAGKTDDAVMGVLFALYIFGIGKAAIMPVHRWLPSAMVAPTPVSALLHAVAVVKAGVFTVLKVTIYVFGIENLNASGQGEWLTYLACATILIASMIALRKNNLKARLAYSTVSQLSYIVLAATLATGTAAIGGAFHIATHAAGKITLFFCAGAIYVAAHKTEIDELDGLGRTMPFTMFAFLIGSLSIIGLPPFGGTWSKWLIGLGALDAGQTFVVAVLMISSLLNVAYLLPIVARAYFLPPPGQDVSNRRIAIKEAPWACVVPLCFTAFLCLVLFLSAGLFESLLAPIGATR
jgi:multicomponent Na+:H+ antiporter subunit D